MASGPRDFLLHVEAGSLVPSPATVRAAAADIEEVRAALASQLGLTDVKFEVFDIDFEEWVVPTGCEDFPDETAVRIKAGSAAAPPLVDRQLSMPSAVPAEGVPPPGSVVLGGLDAMSGGASSAVASTSGHASPVVRTMDLALDRSSTGQLTSHREGGAGPLGLVSPRPNRLRSAQLPAVLPEDSASADGAPSHDELVAQQFFEATTGRSIETAKPVPLSERPRTFDLSGTDVWAGAPVAGGAAEQKPGRLNRIKRSASISVVENLMNRGGNKMAEPRVAISEAEVLDLLTKRGHAFSGWLWKEGDFTGFQRRFFILEGAYVKYFKTDPEGDTTVEPSGAIALRGALVADVPNSKRPFSFKVQLEKKNEHLRSDYILAADAESIMQAWISKLRAAIDALAPLSPADSAVWAGVTKGNGKAGAAKPSIQRVESDETAMMNEMEDMLMMGAELQLTAARQSVNAKGALELYIPPVPSTVRMPAGEDGSGAPSAAEPGPSEAASPSPKKMAKAGRFGAGRRRSLSSSDLSLGGFGEFPQMDTEPEPEPAEIELPTPRDPSTLRSETLTLEMVMRAGSDLDIRHDRVEKQGWLRVVEEAPWRAALRSRRKNRRARRASATAATISSEYWTVLSGTRLVYYRGPERGEVVGGLKLDAGAQVGIDPTLSKVAIVPGWVLAARTQSEANEWVMALTFNCHAAMLAGVEERLRLEAPEVEELLKGTKEKSGSDQRWDACYNHPLRPNRLTLAIEVMQAQRPHAGTKGQQLFGAMAGTDALHVRFWIGIPRGVSAEMDRKSIRDSLLRTGSSSSIGSGSTHWQRLFQTEPRKPARVAPGRCAISFTVMPSIDTTIILPDGTPVRTESVRLRLDLCSNDGTILGWVAVGLTELRDLEDGRVVKNLSEDIQQLRGEVDTGAEAHMRATLGDSARFDEGEGVNIGIGVYRPHAQPSEGALHEVVSQSYMLPVIHHSAKGHRPAAPVFHERPLRSPEQGNAIIATEHLLLPRAGLDVPSAYLAQQVEAMRDDVRSRLADVGVNMKRPGAPPGSEGSSEEEDDFDCVSTGAASRGPAIVTATAPDSNLEAMLAEMQSAQMQLKRFLELTPWYTQISAFMQMLSMQHGSDVSDGGRRDLFFRCSKFKKDREWAFTPINLMQYTITIDDLVLGQKVPPAWNPQLWLVTFGASAAHNYSFKKGGAHIYDTHMAKLAMTMQEKIAEAAEKASMHEAAAISGFVHETTSLVEEKADSQTTLHDVQMQLVDMAMTKEKRMDVILSQILATLTTAFLGILENVLQCKAHGTGDYHHRCMRYIERTGRFLMHVESLLSTWKKELGMLHDLYSAVYDGLNNAVLRCRRATEPAASGASTTFNKCTGIERQPAPHGESGEHQVLVVNLNLSPACFDLLPSRLRFAAVQSGVDFVDLPVDAVIFTQGVNEQQTLSNKSSQMNLDAKQKVQDKINIESLDKLREIHRCYRAADSMIDGSAGQSLEWVSVVDWSGLEAMLAEAELAIKASDGRAEKHALVLQTTQQYCVRLGAARVTCCKSGKDRTGMSSTLEHIRALEESLGRSGYEFDRSAGVTAQDACQTLRGYGVRRENVRMNTGSDRFAFNAVQRNFLPEEYKPPEGAYGKNET